MMAVSDLNLPKPQTESDPQKYSEERAQIIGIAYTVSRGVPAVNPRDPGLILV